MWALIRERKKISEKDKLSTRTQRVIYESITVLLLGRFLTLLDKSQALIKISFFIIQTLTNSKRGNIAKLGIYAIPNQTVAKKSHTSWR